MVLWCGDVIVLWWCYDVVNPVLQLQLYNRTGGLTQTLNFKLYTLHFALSPFTFKL